MIRNASEWMLSKKFIVFIQLHYLLQLASRIRKLVAIWNYRKLIEKYANNPENETAYLFENVLVDGFNMFYNVEAISMGGAGTHRY